MAARAPRCSATVIGDLHVIGSLCSIDVDLLIGAGLVRG